MTRGFDVATSVVASALRLGAGGFARPGARARKEPAQPLELYEYEGCPFCRRVREALSELDLEAIIYPCPRGGTRFRPKAVELGGRERFPLLVDPNTGRSVHESADIVRYLCDTYEGKAGAPGPLGSLGPFAQLGRGLATAVRPQRGRRARGGSRAPERPLELWSFEACPYCRLVREVLCELEIPYLLHNVARGSAHRGAFVERSGRMQVPFLVDPNTGQSLFESADIVRYLEATYGA